MTRIFVNLKRFDVPVGVGGLNRVGSPTQWIDRIIARSAELGIGGRASLPVVYFVPEGLVASAKAARDAHGASVEIGCQSVYRSDVSPGGNFGAFTSLLPASAAVALGAQWTIIGHSEERRDKLDLLRRVGGEDRGEVTRAVDGVLAEQTGRAVERGLGVVFCVGETAAERGTGTPETVRGRVRDVLRRQIREGLADAADRARDGALVIAYEPIWAIGPGKTPPDGATIDETARELKTICRAELGSPYPVVYGGGLKRANAEAIGAAVAVDGGLVALTRFEEPIGFDVDQLAEIIALYRKGATP